MELKKPLLGIRISGLKDSGGKTSTAGTNLTKDEAPGSTGGPSLRSPRSKSA